MSLPQKRASIPPGLLSEFGVPNLVVAELATTSQPLMTHHYDTDPTSGLAALESEEEVATYIYDVLAVSLMHHWVSH